MSTTVKLSISTLAVAAVSLAMPAITSARVHHPPRYIAPNNDYSGVIPGRRYYGPYDERIVTQPNGIVIGTDPDPNIRAGMRRDNIGPNGTNGGAPN